jgi:hypothetical protein
MGEHIFIEEELFMNKEKKFFVGMAAFVLVLGASLFFIGCGSGDADTVTLRTESISGNMPAAELEQLIAEAAQEGAVKIRYVTVTGGGSVNLGSASVLITGWLNLGSAVLAAAEASVSFASDATIGGTGIIIGDEDDFADNWATGNSITVYPSTESENVATELASGTVATKDYTLTTFGYSNDLYVYGTLTVSGSATAPSGDGVIYAVGTVEVTGNNTVVLANPAKVDYSGATIKVGADATSVEVTFAEAGTGKAQFDVASGKTLKVLGATTVGAAADPVSVSGPGTLVLAAAVTAANITGSGTIAFTDAEVAATDFTTSASSVIGSTVTFTNGLSTAESAPLTLGGKIILPSEQAITFGEATGTLRLLASTTIRKAASDTAPLLTATTTALLTPAEGATLTAASSTQVLTVATAALELTSGSLAVGTAGTLAIEAAASGEFTVATAGSLTVEGTLSIGAAGTLATVGSGTVTAGSIVLGAGTWLATGAATTVTPGVITLASDEGAEFGADAGTTATVLTGGAAATNTFTASGGTITLGQAVNKLTITGSAASAKLATGDTAGIKVKAGLDITTATVDISSAVTSVIVLVEGDATGITLTNANSVILLDATKATVKTSAKKEIDDLTNGGTVEVWAESDDGSVDVGKFVGGAVADTNTLVEGGSSGFVIKKSIQTAAS